jgi:hypothetical protein
MAVGLVLQFAKARRAHYDTVNRLLGIDMKRGTGKWPPGLLSHAAGTTDNGDLVITEVWESRRVQGQFMADRLADAIQKAGAEIVPQMTWMEIISYHTPATARRNDAPAEPSLMPAPAKALAARSAARSRCG